LTVTRFNDLNSIRPNPHFKDWPVAIIRRAMCWKWHG